MLVLGRRAGERITVSGPCTITIVRCSPGLCRVGIDAERGVIIMRAELEKPAENRQQQTGTH